MEEKLNSPSSYVYVSVWITLLALTIITLISARFHFGNLNIIIALLIASFKALIVALFFMHLKYERSLFKNSIVFVLFTIVVIIGLTFFDTALR